MIIVYEETGKPGEEREIHVTVSCFFFFFFTGHYMTFNATIEPYVEVMSNGTFILSRKERKGGKKN